MNLVTVCSFLLILLLSLKVTAESVEEIGFFMEDISSPTLATSESELLQHPTNLPVFIEEPIHSYVIKNKPAFLHCRAAHALQVYFQCDGARKQHGPSANIPPIQQDFVDPQTGVRNVEASIYITRNDVEEYFGKEKFKCECIAWSSRGQIHSQPATVDVAYLNKHFEAPPYSQAVEVGGSVELRCHPPLGVPPPTVYWLKNSAPLETDTNLIVSREGHLLVGQARLEDTANYTCVAENVAAHRLSEAARLIVYVNGGWSPWSAWSECSPSCGHGMKKRSRLCINPAPFDGGLTCQGPSVQRSDCTSECPVVDGRWALWSTWSTCGSDCKQYRRRSCTNPTPSNGGRYCAGTDYMTTNCTEGLCPGTRRDLDNFGGAQLSGEDSRAKTEVDMELCIGLAVALAVFVLVGLFVVKILQRKGRDDSLASDYQPEYFPERDKKNLFMSPSCHRHHPELAQSVSLPPCYEYPYSDPIHSKLELRRSCSEHHYDVPHFSNSHCHALTSPSVSSHSVDSSICPASATPPVDIKSVKNHHSDSNQSISSFFSSSSSADSICDVTSGLTTSTDLMDSVSLTTAYVMTCGGRLSLPESSVSLTIPEGAVAKGTRHKVLIAVLREDRHRPKLPERQTQLSPVVMSGPLGLTFKKPVILNFQHCASLKHSPWNVSVWCSSSQLDESPVWQKVVVLGEETINTPMFTQLDHNQVYLITDQLMRFVIVGESDKNLNKAVKILCLAVFAPAPEFHPQMLDYNVRVYTLEDTVAALEGVKVMESKLGGCLLDKPKTMLFQDGGANLCLSIEDICPGWRCKPQADYQEIPFQHVWNSTHNHLHCSFTLQRTDRLQDTGAFRILVCQKGIQTNRQLFCINTEIHSTTSITSLVPRSPVPSQTPTVTTSSGCSSMNTTLENASSPFRIPQVVKSQVCQYLDPPNARGNDWRMLAQRLKVDRYINYFATKASPTEHILDLWEARHQECSAVPDLLNILRVMGRFDASLLLEKELGPWV